MQQLKEQIRNLIMQNETDIAVDTLLAWSKSSYLNIYDQCVLLRARLEQIERETNTNLISSEDAMRQMNQVNAALLNLISDLETGAVAQNTSTVTPGIKPTNYLSPMLVGTLILLIGVGIYLALTTPILTAIFPVAGPLATDRVLFPEGKRVVLIENSQEITYEILNAKTEVLNPQQLRLALQIRCTPKTTYRQAVNFWSRDFRLECPGLPPLSPSNDLNLVVEGGSYQDGAVEFLLPVQSHAAKLSIQFGSQTTQLSMEW